MIAWVEATLCPCGGRRLVGALCLFIAAAAGAVGPDRGAVASAHPDASAAGVEILAAGGNAFDAAVAVSAALAVVEPYSSGIGGGGFWLLHRASDGFETMVDGRERAPGAASRDMYLDADGNVIPRASMDGPLAAGIPGTIAALDHIAGRYGRLPLARSLAPAIRLAREGFQVRDRYRLLAGFRTSVLRSGGDAGAIFLVDGEVPEYGAIIRQPDLAEYRVVERAPVTGSFRDIRVVTAAPPSAGGIVLMEALNILEPWALESMDAVQQRHLVIEAMRRAYRDRADYLGDPDFVEMPIERLLDKDYAAGLRAGIDPDRATPSESLPPIGVSDNAGTDTTHFSVIDTEGNRVAATLSVNFPFGAGFVPAGTGVVLNNEMDDFSSRVLTPNGYGLVSDTANAIAPGKRPLSSMTPTFLQSPDRVAVLGTPGGSRIISMVLLGVLDFAAGNGPRSWVSRTRFHHQYLPDRVQFEKDGFSAAEQAALQARGHSLDEVSRNYGNMHAIQWRLSTGEVEAASDPRGEGGVAWHTP